MVSVVVLGAGAVGSLFGARLAAAGNRVLLVGRPAHVEAVRADGLVVEGLEPGRFRLEATATLPPGADAEIVLLTTKSFDLEAASEAVARAVRPAPSVALGNGLGIESLALAGLQRGGWTAAETVLVRAIHTVPATLLGPGRVRASGTGEVVFGRPEAAGAAAQATRVAVELFRRSGFSVRESPDLELELWRKAAVNAAVNPVTARRRVRNGALLEGPARSEAESLLAEAVAVASAVGVALTLDVARADLARVLTATAENRSSMLQDVERGRPTEIEAISGEILRRGEALGLALPATRRAVAEVLRLAGSAQR